jgi:hypothetical protein
MIEHLCKDRLFLEEVVARPASETKLFVGLINALGKDYGDTTKTKAFRDKLHQKR